MTATTLRNRQRRRAAAVVAATVLASAAVALAPAGPARAAVFPVNNLNPSGAGSLVAAIAAANMTFGPDLIVFNVPAGQLPGTIDVSGQSLTVTDDLTIQGPGADLVTVSGNGFFVQGGADFEISDLTVTGASSAIGAANAGALTARRLALTGNSFGMSVSGANGSIELTDIAADGNEFMGLQLFQNQVDVVLEDITASGHKYNGISITQATSVDLRDVVASGNGTDSGGQTQFEHGINVESIGTVQVVNVTADENRQYGLRVSLDPGLLGNPADPGGATTLLGLRLNGNQAGGLEIYRNGGDVSITDLVSRDSNGNGIAAGEIGTLAIDRARVYDNVARGLSLESEVATLTVRRSQFLRDGFQPFFATNVSGSTRISESTFAGNEVDGIQVTRDVHIVNSTIVANNPAGDPDPLNRSAIQWGDNTGTYELVIDNSTITGNANYPFGSGGGGAVTIRNTILSGNGLSAVPAGFTVDVSHSLVPNAAWSALGTGNVVAADPRLGALRNNGGPTSTRSPLAGSPAIDAGDPAFDLGATPTDQRGLPRRVGGRIDIGAVEFVPAGTPTPPAPPDPDAAIVPTDPTRYLDTRALPTYDGTYTAGGRPAAGETLRIEIAGRSGGPVPSGAIGVVANVVAVLPDGPGHATLFACGDDVPLASHLNYVPGDVVANNVIVPLDDDGALCLNTYAGADYVLDVNGYVPAGSPVEMFAPTRFVDTRGGDPVAAGSYHEVQIAGAHGVAADARSAIVSVTAITPDGPGFVSLFPCTGDPIAASTLNYLAGQVVPNGAVVDLSSTGRLCIYTYARAHLLLDVAGYVPDGVDSLTTRPAVRMWDSRAGEPVEPGGPAAVRVPAGGMVEVPIAGRGGVPDNATAALLNVATVLPDAPTFITMWPCGTLPEASNLNLVTGGLRANNALTKLSPEGSVCLFSLAGSDVVLDLTGWLS